MVRAHGAAASVAAQRASLPMLPCDASLRAAHESKSVPQQSLTTAQFGRVHPPLTCLGAPRGRLKCGGSARRRAGRRRARRPGCGLEPPRPSRCTRGSCSAAALQYHIPTRRGALGFLRQPGSRASFPLRRLSCRRCLRAPTLPPAAENLAQTPPVRASHRCTGCALPVVAKQQEAGSAADMAENQQ